MIQIKENQPDAWFDVPTANKHKDASKRNVPVRNSALTFSVGRETFVTESVCLRTLASSPLNPRMHSIGIFSIFLNQTLFRKPMNVYEVFQVSFEGPSSRQDPRVIP